MMAYVREAKFKIYNAHDLFYLWQCILEHFL